MTRDTPDSFFDEVKEWHRKMFLRQGLDYRVDTVDRVWMGRIRLITEELAELAEAIAKDDWVEFADALADLTWVVLGTAVEFDIPFNEVWEEVKRSNFTKIGGKPDSGGKIIKPEGYSPPNISAILTKEIDGFLNKKMDNETAGEHIHIWKQVSQRSQICVCGISRLK